MNFDDVFEKAHQNIVKRKQEELPMTVELEFGLLGCILIQNDLLDHLLFLAPEHFSVPEHAKFYAEMIEMRAEGTLITPFSLSNGDRHFKGSVQYLAKAAAYCTAVLQPINQAHYIVETAERRAIVIACQKMIDDVRTCTRTPSEHVVELNAELEKAISVGTSKKFLTDVQVSRNILLKLKSPPEPIKTGLQRLDVCMDGGLYPGMTYVFGGRKKMGKTTLAGTISCNLNQPTARYPKGVKHLYIAAEMGVEQIQQRNLARLTDSLGNSFRTNYGKSEHFQNKISGKIEESCGAIVYLDAPGITFEELRRAVAQAVSIHGIKGFILDSLQLVGGKEPRKSQAEHQDEVSQWCADFSRKHNLFDIITAQINQQGNIRGGEGVRMACDMAFEIKAPENDPSRSGRWLEMIETRYTQWSNMGKENSPGMYMTETGPYFKEEPLEQTQEHPIGFL